MGIKGLTSYVDSVGSLWTKLKLQNTKVILDGGSLYHHLHIRAKLNCRCGGQYTELHDITVSFFNSLKSNNVEAFVLLDGAYDASEKKLATLAKRTKDRILKASKLANSREIRKNVLPLLASRNFVQTMEELEVKFAVCDW